MTLCGYNATALPNSETHATLVDEPEILLCLSSTHVRRRSGLIYGEDLIGGIQEGGPEMNLWVDQYRHESGVAVHDWTYVSLLYQRCIQGAEGGFTIIGRHRLSQIRAGKSSPIIGHTLAARTQERVHSLA